MPNRVYVRGEESYGDVVKTEDGNVFVKLDSDGVVVSCHPDQVVDASFPEPPLPEPQSGIFVSDNLSFTAIKELDP